MADPIAVPESQRDASKRYTPEGYEVPAPSDNDVLYEVDGTTAWITFNRPLVLNAVDWSVRLGFSRAIARAEADDGVHVVVIRGAGRAFCAGGDLQGSKVPDGLEVPETLETVRRMWDMPKPVIAAVHGYALGQGCEIAGMCDLTIAAEGAKFGEIQIRHGWSTPMLITPFLAGLKGAKEILLTGELFDAVDAQRLGLVNRVVPADRLFDEVGALAGRIGSLPTGAVGLNKMLINRVHELSGMREAMDYHDDPVIKAFEGVAQGDPLGSDRLQTLREQGWEAFRQKRDAAYRG